MTPAHLFATPNALAAHYSRFRVGKRLLLTGHSHQAWPDCGYDAVQRAWADAAEMVDDKWGRVFEQVGRVQRGYARLLNDPDADITIDQNTLELAVRLVSALPLRSRPKLVATDGEFHTLRRLLDRLGEEAGIEVVRVPAADPTTLAERLAAAVDGRTAAVFCSTVLFQTGRIVPHLPAVAEACARHGAELLLDAYHHLNAVPFDPTGLERAFVVGGGYKYCQLGEGVCFLRVPKGCELRPISTGWFTEFDALANTPSGVGYGRGGMRFAGATFDPTSAYRAAAVFDFFQHHGLTSDLLREVSQHQVKQLAERFDALNLHPDVIRRDTAVPLDQVGGFLVLWSPRAAEISRRLKDEEGVWTDARGDALRLGPAPYLSDAQLVEAVERLGRVCRRTG